jgi:hypothetical protein
MMEYLLAKRALLIDIERGRCCSSDGHASWRREDFESGVRFLRGFFDLWPDHLTAQMEK